MLHNNVDLHIHTTASSDGQHGPEEIFAMAKAINLGTIAFADHNSVGSIEAGLELSKKYAIELIPCFELNTLFDGMDIHLLGYFIEHRNNAFHRWLEEIHEAKHEQATKRLQALKALDFDIDEGDLEREAKGMVPSGATFLAALFSRNKGAGDPRLQPYIDGERSKSPALNFYKDYFKKEGPAFIPLDVCSTARGIEKIKEFGGVPVQAHPSDTGDGNIETLIAMGLMGIEAYSSYHSDEECEHFRRLAEENHILHTAGSDFHGMKIKPDVDFGAVRGNDYSIVERLKDARKKI